MGDKQKGYGYFPLLDGIRGIAAILVVLRHTTPYFGAIAFQESYLAVDVFFVLSGFVLANAYERKLAAGLSPGQFFRLRLIRIYPLYLLGFAISIISRLALGGVPETPIMSARVIVFALLLVPNPGNSDSFSLNPPAWSLFLELIANIAYASTIRFLSTRVLVAVLIFSGIGLIAILAMHPSHTLDLGWASDEIYAGLFRDSYSFFAGVLIHRVYKGRSRQPSSGIIAALMSSVIMASVGILLTSGPSRAVQPYFDFIAVVLVFPAIVYAALGFVPAMPIVSIFKFLGTVSYGIYAIHYPLGVFINGAFTIFFEFSVCSYAPWSGFVLLGALLSLCWVLDKIYDGPVRSFLVRNFCESKPQLDPDRAPS